jgi:hypothetical protein
MAKIVEHLPSKHQALSSKSQYLKRKEKRSQTLKRLLSHKSGAFKKLRVSVI